ncbi:flagellar motor protein MotB [Niallia sp. Krafla_26]|uniref:flagellar motor protein MotB n=1 Tax=Niallia sp. Krafla_26 TaxID=3064703 RepID=UPI003D173C49
MSKRRKKGKHEEHIDESWLLPYSDLLTLLVALFIVLFASSSIDMQKFQSISNAFNAELTGGSGMFDYPSPIPEGSKGSSDELPESDETQEEHYEKTSTLSEEERAELEKLAQIQNHLNAYVQENGLGDQLNTALTVEGLSLTIRDNILYTSGSAQVQSENMPIAREISKILEMDVPRSIIISGHTDNVPIRNSQFSSNWELSVMRAVNFMKVLLENPNLKPELFTAKGSGEFQPIATNETAEGRAQNRRVEILIQPKIEENSQASIE